MILISQKMTGSNIKVGFSLFLFFFCFFGFSQPQKVNYQAVALNSAGKPVKNQIIQLRLSIVDSNANGTVLYTETHQPTTDGSGQFSVFLGGGTTTMGTFSNILWSNGKDKFLKTEADVTGGANFVIIGTSQIVSVPYALYAEISGSSIPGPQGPQGPAGTGGFTHFIGEYFGGGIVFAIWKDSLQIEHGLIAAPSNIGLAYYMTYYNNDAGINSQNQFSGNENINAILNNDRPMPNPGGFTNAAFLAEIYSNDGFSDWYLPSIKELEEFGKNNLIVYKSRNGTGHLQPSGNITSFWSSTQFSNNSAYSYDIFSGVSTSWKASDLIVRPIRKF